MLIFDIAYPPSTSRTELPEDIMVFPYFSMKIGPLSGWRFPHFMCRLTLLFPALALISDTNASKNKKIERPRLDPLRAEFRHLPTSGLKQHTDGVDNVFNPASYMRSSTSYGKGMGLMLAKKGPRGYLHALCSTGLFSDSLSKDGGFFLSSKMLGIGDKKLRQKRAHDREKCLNGDFSYQNAESWSSGTEPPYSIIGNF